MSKEKKRGKVIRNEIYSQILLLSFSTLFTDCRQLNYVIKSARDSLRGKYHDEESRGVTILQLITAKLIRDVFGG